MKQSIKFKLKKKVWDIKLLNKYQCKSKKANWQSIEVLFFTITKLLHQKTSCEKVKDSEVK